jgi:outer membrane receptor protein involved in Fe transport
MQSIPLSITAITGDSLQKRGITDFFQYAVTIPNLSFGAAFEGILSGRSISIRGIQGRNTTGFYLDDTPLTETIDPKLLDIERIEVLRGPQGTLYGARSLGGMIRHVTRRPDFDAVSGRVRTEISATDESDDLNYIVQGSVNVPFSDSSAAIFSAYYEDSAGIFDRAVGTIADYVSMPATLVGEPTVVVKDVDSRETIALQASFRFDPNDRLSILPRVIYQRTELDGFPLADIDTQSFTQNRDFNIAEGGEDEWTLLSLNIDYQTDVGTLTSATSYFDRETFEFETSGFINFLQALPESAGGFGLFDVIGVIPIPESISRTFHFESTVQELRFASDLDNRWNYVVGAFYQSIDDTSDWPRNLAVGLEDNFALLQQTLGIPGPLEDIWPFGDLVLIASLPTQVKETGVFGELTFEFTDKWSGTVGARWFDTKISSTVRAAGFVIGVPLADDVGLETTPELAAEKSNDGVIYKAALEYQATDDVYFYATIAEGFRLGGVNFPIPDTLGCSQDLIDLGLQNLDRSSFDSDDLISSEIGIKTNPTPGSQLNLSIFRIDFDEIQQNVQLVCGFNFVGNFGSARSQGIEVEYSARLTDNLAVSVNVGYTDAEFTETTFGGELNNKGDPLQFVPELTAFAAVDYIRPAAINGLDLFIRGDIAYVDESLSLVNSIPRIRPAYEYVNLRIGLANEKYTGTIFVRNLTNDIANLADNRSIAAEYPGRPRFVISRPRTVGFELAVNF